MGSPIMLHPRTSNEAAKVESEIFRAANSLFPIFSTARIWSSQHPFPGDFVVSNAELDEVLSDQQSFLNALTNESQTAPPKFTLVSVFGEPSSGNERVNSLQARTKCLGNLLHIAGLHDRRQVSNFIKNKIPFTHSCVKYSQDGKTPVALTILFLCPKISNNILGAIRIDIQTRNCFAFISSRFEADGQDVISCCRRNVDLLRINPLYILLFIHENRIQRWSNLFETVWQQVVEAETATNMILPQWRLPTDRQNTISDSDRLLTQLHSTHIELSHFQGIISFGQSFGSFCIQTASQVETYRETLGYTPLPPRDQHAFEDYFKMMQSQSESTKNRVLALTNRLSGMINVSFNLIAQRDSKVNFEIAKLQAKESRTVKGIAILTFSLLPATFLATLWTTNLFQLDRDKNWLVFIGSVLGLTFLVFACSFAYSRVARKWEEAHWPDPLKMDTLPGLLPV